MASLSVDKRAVESKRTRSEKEIPLRKLRRERELTQAALAQLAGMHRNSIVKLENGTTREVTAENATAMAAALKVPVSDLGLIVRPAGQSRALRIRQLTAEQRAIVDDLLALPPDDYALLRAAIEKLRRKRRKKRPVRGKRRD